VSAAALAPAHGDYPPPALQALAADTGASLAFTAAAGWHLLPDPELVRQVQALDRREARRKTPPRFLCGRRGRHRAASRSERAVAGLARRVARHREHRAARRAGLRRRTTGSVTR
jgi:hypothetical protein